MKSEIGIAHRLERDTKIEAIEQGTGQARSIALDHRRLATTSSESRSGMPARARVHGGDQLKARGIFRLRTHPRHRYAPRLERLAQRLEHSTIEFG
jgi:hypothetical protein